MLKAKWFRDSTQFRADAELTKRMAEEIVAEIDREILADLNSSARMCGILGMLLLDGVRYPIKDWSMYPVTKGSYRGSATLDGVALDTDGPVNAHLVLVNATGDLYLVATWVLVVGQAFNFETTDMACYQGATLESVLSPDLAAV